jgi:hypothetical protein
MDQNMGRAGAFEGGQPCTHRSRARGAAFGQHHGFGRGKPVHVTGMQNDDHPRDRRHLGHGPQGPVDHPRACQRLPLLWQFATGAGAAPGGDDEGCTFHARS